MATPSGAFDTYQAVGNREDLADVIYNISPTETPFMSMIAGRGTATGTVHEWQKDSLASAAANAQIEGEDATYSEPATTTRLRNELQLSWKTAMVTGTQEAVDKAGRNSELAYQLMKRAKELKRDMEFTLCGNQARAVGSTSAARTFAALENWFQTNPTTANGLIGATGANCAATGGIPDAAAQRTDGTARDPSEAHLRTGVRLAWEQGGDPTVILCNAVNKQKIGAFVGSTTRTIPNDASTRKYTNAVDVYESDFGTHKVVPSRFLRATARTAIFILTPELWSVDYLRAFKQFPLAKVGDAERRQMLAEYTLVAKQEAGNSGVFDLNLT